MSLVEFPPEPRVLPEEKEALYRAPMTDDEIIAFKDRLRGGHHDLLDACSALAGHLVTYGLSMTPPREEGNPYRQGPTIHTIEDLQFDTARHAILMYVQAQESLDLPGAGWSVGGPQPQQLRYGWQLQVARFKEIILGDKNGE